MLLQTDPPFNPVDLDPRQHRIVGAHFFGLTVADMRRAKLVARLCELGPRSILELLSEVATDHNIGADIDARLERYGRLSPVTVAQLGGRHLPEPQLMTVPQ